MISRVRSLVASCFRSTDVGMPGSIVRPPARVVANQRARTREMCGRRRCGSSGGARGTRMEYRGPIIALLVMYRITRRSGVAGGGTDPHLWRLPRSPYIPDKGLLSRTSVRRWREIAPPGGCPATYQLISVSATCHLVPHSLTATHEQRKSPRALLSFARLRAAEVGRQPVSSSMSPYGGSSACPE
jgi:hypothetical protein